jgi:hypothetical protein
LLTFATISRLLLKIWGASTEFYQKQISKICLIPRF